MKIASVPYLTQERCRFYFEYMWELHKGFTLCAAESPDMPSTLRVEVSNCRRLHFVLAHPCFTFCDRGLLKGLAYALVPRVCPPAETIIREGEVRLRRFGLRCFKRVTGV